jgi:hypothetical protein
MLMIVSSVCKHICNIRRQEWSLCHLVVRTSKKFVTPVWLHRKSWKFWTPDEECSTVAGKQRVLHYEANRSSIFLVGDSLTHVRAITAEWGAIHSQCRIDVGPSNPRRLSIFVILNYIIDLGAVFRVWSPNPWSPSALAVGFFYAALPSASLRDRVRSNRSKFDNQPSNKTATSLQLECRRGGVYEMVNTENFGGALIQFSWWVAIYL